MPSRAATPVSRGTQARDAARRRAAQTLTVAASICAYAARSIGNGASPEQATLVVIATADELETTARSLRRLALARLDPPERRRIVAELAALGMSHRRIAEQVGVAKRTVWADLHPRP